MRTPGQRAWFYQQYKRHKRNTRALKRRLRELTKALRLKPMNKGMREFENSFFSFSSLGDGVSRQR